jgi:hypothetical protein
LRRIKEEYSDEFRATIWLASSNHMAMNVDKHTWLTDAQGKSLGLRVDGLTRLGRASDNDIVLEDSTVSQRHAAISFDDGRAFLRDLGSSNGTFIEGSRVSGGRLTNGTVIKLGRVALVYRENVGAYSAAPFLSTSPDRARSLASGRTAPSQANFFSAKTGAILGALFLLGLVGMLAGHALFSPSSSSVGYSGAGTLVDSQSYRLPDASSDFVGSWCGWTRVVTCEPADSCDEEPVPESMGFQSDAGGVVMHYIIQAKPDTDIRDIQVHAMDSRHVRVKYIARRTGSTGLEIIINARDEFVSVNPEVVQNTSTVTWNVNGISARSEEDSTELRKCTDEFRAAEQKYEEGKNMVDKGEVTGQVPSK